MSTENNPQEATGADLTASRHSAAQELEAEALALLQSLPEFTPPQRPAEPGPEADYRGALASLAALGIDPDHPTADELDAVTAAIVGLMPADYRQTPKEKTA